MPATCTWWEPTGRVRLYLRRYHPGCPSGPKAYCNAVVPFQDVPARRQVGENGYPYLGSVDDLAPPDEDPRWPRACTKCGQAFAPEVVHQVAQEEILRSQDGREAAREDLPLGAMFDGWWLHDVETNGRKWVGHDGICLMVILPGLEGWGFPADGPSSGATAGQFWTRVGDPRRPETVSVTPSIFVNPPGGWHGYLTNGVLNP